LAPWSAALASKTRLSTALAAALGAAAAASSSPSSRTMAAAATVRVRRSAERGSADHGWLQSRFTFSFAEYSDPRFDSFGVLRVLNDDTVASAEGFPTHGHRDFEIWSYILGGRLEHKDSMGNSEVLSRGHVQLTSAGTGIRHSEFNADKRQGGDVVRFLQIWAQPAQRGVKPSYQTGFFDEARKLDALVQILAAGGAGGAAGAASGAGAGGPAAPAKASTEPLVVGTDLRMHASILRPGARVSLEVPAGHRRAYVHVPIIGKSAGVEITAAGAAPVRLAPGDGAFVENLGGPIAFVGLGEAAVGGAGGGGAGAAADSRTEFVVMDFA